ncbi:MAG: hypothetical protein EZS28_031265 [Streblomastix strix]|uniref:Uncharacterized protein n=1 Tax=Streblomastix strix TaxID=222440 RepID=A0A5J4US34_9EUKA|nr:MAG: hypothetical protein EZS28_031265 [Streblomastix strix]
MKWVGSNKTLKLGLLFHVIADLNPSVANIPPDPVPPQLPPADAALTLKIYLKKNEDVLSFMRDLLNQTARTAEELGRQQQIQAAQTLIEQYYYEKLLELDPSIKRVSKREREVFHERIELSQGIEINKKNAVAKSGDLDPEYEAKTCRLLVEASHAAPAAIICISLGGEQSATMWMLTSHHVNRIITGDSQQRREQAKPVQEAHVAPQVTAAVSNTLTQVQLYNQPQIIRIVPLTQPSTFQSSGFSEYQQQAGFGQNYYGNNRSYRGGRGGSWKRCRQGNAFPKQNNNNNSQIQNQNQFQHLFQTQPESRTQKQNEQLNQARFATYTGMRTTGTQQLKDKVINSDSDEDDEQVDEFKQLGSERLGGNNASETTRSLCNIGTEQIHNANTIVGSN